MFALGAIIIGLVVAAVAGLFQRPPRRPARAWIYVGVFTAGNVLLVVTNSALPAVVGIAAMLLGLIAIWRLPPSRPTMGLGEHL